MAKGRLRVEDQLEYNLRDLSEKLKLINKIVVVVILAFGMFLGVKSCNTYNNTIGKMYDSFNDLSSLFGSSMSLDKPGSGVGTFFLLLIIFAVLAGIVWLTLTLVCFVLDYLVDMHYYARTQTEILIEGDSSEEQSESAPLSMGAMLPGDWKCSSCGRIHKADEMTCICGGRKPGQKIYVPENDWVCAG